MQAESSAVSLNDKEITLLIEALDSHEYWQLSEPSQRNSGYSLVDDGESAEIDATRALAAKLERSRQNS